MKAQNFVSGITLRDGRRARIKIGIHSGDVMCGVIGDIKPQFSIIGTDVTKANEICKACPGNSIYISKKSYKKIIDKVTNFQFEEIEIIAKGGKAEKVFQVRKRRGIKKRLANQKQLRMQATGSLSMKMKSTMPKFGGQLEN